MAKKEKNDKPKIPEWFDGIKEQSIKNALKAGIIYPKFKAYKNTVYTVYLISEPKYVESDKGNFHTIDLEKDNMRFTLNMNESFKFQLKLLLERNQITLKGIINRSVPLHISQDSQGYWSIQLP